MYFICIYVFCAHFLQIELRWGRGRASKKNHQLAAEDKGPVNQNKIRKPARDSQDPDGGEIHIQVKSSHIISSL